MFSCRSFLGRVLSWFSSPFRPAENAEGEGEQQQADKPAEEEVGDSFSIIGWEIVSVYLIGDSFCVIGWPYTSAVKLRNIMILID